MCCAGDKLSTSTVAVPHQSGVFNFTPILSTSTDTDNSGRPQGVLPCHLQQECLAEHLAISDPGFASYQ